MSASTAFDPLSDMSSRGRKLIRGRRGIRPSVSASIAQEHTAMSLPTSSASHTASQEDADCMSTSVDGGVPSFSQPSGSRQKKRGRGKGLGVRLRPGQKLLAVIHDNRIVTKRARTELGVILRENIKGPWCTWRDVPLKNRDIIWAQYTEKFEFDIDEAVAHKVVMSHLGRIYGDVMYDWRKRTWKEFQTIEERKQHPPSNVTRKVWSKLVDYWSSQAFKEKSSKNSANREKSDILHTSGSRPFAEHRLQHVKETGNRPSPIDMWKKVHSKDGKGVHWSSEKAKEYYDQLEHMRSTVSSQGLINFDELAAYKQVIGGANHGRVTGYGVGVKGSELFGRYAGGCRSDQCKAEREHYHTEIQEHQSEIQQLRSQMEVIQTQIMQALRVAGLNPPTSSEALVQGAANHDDNGNDDDDGSGDDEDYHEEEEEEEEDDD